MMSYQLPLTLIATVFTVTASASAQTVAPPGFAFGGSVGAISLSPEAEAREWGIHYEGYLRYTLASGLQVAAGVGYSPTDIDQEGIDEKRNVINIFIDPRLALQSSGSRFTPFVGGRIAYAHHSLDTPFLGFGVLTRSGDGWMFAGAVGLLARFAEQMAFEANLTLGLAAFGDYELNDEVQDGTSSSEYFGNLSVGLVYSFSSSPGGPER